MNKALPLRIACPACGSPEVFYSCTPNCCFNHVCAECQTTFEPETRPTGAKLDSIIPPDPAPDSSRATAECAACHSIAVCSLEDGRVACPGCRAILELVLVVTAA
jgi:hypothetical protein